MIRASRDTCVVSFETAISGQMFSSYDAKVMIRASSGTRDTSYGAIYRFAPNRFAPYFFGQNRESMRPFFSGPEEILAPSLFIWSLLPLQPSHVLIVSFLLRLFRPQDIFPFPLRGESAAPPQSLRPPRTAMKYPYSYCRDHEWDLGVESS